MKQRGFTIIEVLVVILLLAVITAVAWTQISILTSMRRDDARRTAINALHYNLEDVYYVKNKSYPSTIDKDALTAIDPGLLTDPDGVMIGEADSNYKYLPTDCKNKICKGYTLRSTMEREADYIKTNRDRS